MTKHTYWARRSHGCYGLDNSSLESEVAEKSEEIVLDVKEEVHAGRGNVHISGRESIHSADDCDAGDVLSGRGELGNRMKLNRSKSTEGMWDRPQQPSPNDAAVIAAATRIQAVARGRQSRKKA